MAKNNGGRKATATQRPYVVVKVDGKTLEVLEPEAVAKSPQAAMDAVIATMPPERRNVVLGAFLASSYREKQYSTQQTWDTTSSERQPSFFKPQATEQAAEAS